MAIKTVIKEVPGVFGGGTGKPDQTFPVGAKVDTTTTAGAKVNAMHPDKVI